MPRALISVHDKTGIDAFARELVALGFEIVASGGTAAHLADVGIAVTDVAEITGIPPILDHRVVTLHPKVHGAILADPDDPGHRDDMAAHGIGTIDLVVVGLYPFAARPGTEMIDIGGPALVRAAAKNHVRVGVIVDPADHGMVLEALRGGTWDVELRRHLAHKAFRITSAYDAAVSSWLGRSDPTDGVDTALPQLLTLVAERDEVLRYGENPDQSGARYRLPGAHGWWESALQLNGKEMSYLNVLDAEAAWQLVNRFDRPAATVVKHANPCGVAVASNAAEAYRRAHGADPTSAFGGVVAINREVDAETAAAIAEVFTEVVIAPSYTAEALDVLCAKPALRVLEASPPMNEMVIDVRSIDGGLLVQTEPASTAPDPASSRVVGDVVPTEAQWNDLRIADVVAAATWSNAVVLVYDGATVGIGGGQPNRVDAARLAIGRAGDRGRGAVAASDGFFPFRDGLDVLGAAGVAAVIQPGGSVRDAESIEAANEHRMAMVFGGVRRFRH